MCSTSAEMKVEVTLCLVRDPSLYTMTSWAVYGVSFLTILPLTVMFTLVPEYRLLLTSCFSVFIFLSSNPHLK